AAQREDARTAQRAGPFDDARSGARVGHGVGGRELARQRRARIDVRHAAAQPSRVLRMERRARLGTERKGGAGAARGRVWYARKEQAMSGKKRPRARWSNTPPPPRTQDRSTAPPPPVEQPSLPPSEPPLETTFDDGS